MEKEHKEKKERMEQQKRELEKRRLEQEEARRQKQFDMEEKQKKDKKAAEEEQRKAKEEAELRIKAQQEQQRQFDLGYELKKVLGSANEFKMNKVQVLKEKVKKFGGDLSKWEDMCSETLKKMKEKVESAKAEAGSDDKREKNLDDLEKHLDFEMDTARLVQSEAMQLSHLLMEKSDEKVKQAEGLSKEKKEESAGGCFDYGEHLLPRCFRQDLEQLLQSATTDDCSEIQRSFVDSCKSVKFLFLQLFQVCLKHAGIVSKMLSPEDPAGSGAEANKEQRQVEVLNKALLRELAQHDPASLSLPSQCGAGCVVKAFPFKSDLFQSGTVTSCCQIHNAPFALKLRLIEEPSYVSINLQGVNA